ncbi:MAG: DUF3862 domain-containing protein, partial [Candidatus Hydrogenedens sp.]
MSKLEKSFSEETKPTLTNIVQQAEESGENTQAGEPVRVQSTMTPAIDIQNQQKTISENTTEIMTYPEGTEIAQSQGDQIQETSSDKNTEEENPTISLEPFSKVKLGMSYEDVVSLLGEPDYLITQSSDKQMKLYRWNRKEKVLYGRFEKGVLKRYSGRTETSENTTNPLTRELYDQLREGMELDEVVAILQRAGTQVSSDNKGGVLYLWTDKGGSSFSARFENNKLVRKSGFYVRPTPIDEKQMTEERQAEENMEGAVEMNPTEEGGENPIEEEKTEVVEEPVYQQPNRVVPQSVNKEPTQTRPDNRRIVYAGSPRKFSDENREADFVKQSSLKRKAKLPGYTYQLRDGSYEIKIYNPL